MHMEFTDLSNRLSNLRDSLLMRLHKNKGVLSRRRRESEFAELSDHKVVGIEEAYREAFSD